MSDRIDGSPQPDEGSWGDPNAPLQITRVIWPDERIVHVVITIKNCGVSGCSAAEWLKAQKEKTPT